MQVDPTLILPKKKKRPRHSPLQHGNFSLLSELAEKSVDALEHIGTMLLEDAGVCSTLCVGFCPATETPDSWGGWKLKGYYTDGLFHVLEPLETKLLKLNQDNTDLATPEVDVAAKPLPLHQNEASFGRTNSRASLLYEIDKEGAQFVVNSSGELLVNFTNSTLDESNSGAGRYVLSHTTDAERMTNAWISELVRLPDAKLVPYAAPEERTVFSFMPLSKSVTLSGRPRVYARIPMATRMPKDTASIWYAMLPCNLRAAAAALQEGARKAAGREERRYGIFEPRLGSLISATIWHYMFAPYGTTCGQTKPMRSETLAQFLSPANAQKRALLRIDNTTTFLETNAGERLKLASMSGRAASLSEAQRRLLEEADALLDL